MQEFIFHRDILNTKTSFNEFKNFLPLWVHFLHPLFHYNAYVLLAFFLLVKFSSLKPNCLSI